MNRRITLWTAAGVMLLRMGLAVWAGTNWTGNGYNNNHCNFNQNWDGAANPSFVGAASVTFGTGTNGCCLNRSGGVYWQGITFSTPTNFAVTYSFSQAGWLTLGTNGITASAPDATPRQYLVTDDITLAADQT